MPENAKYVFICAASEPMVKFRKAKENKLFIKEKPFVSSIYEGQKLADSKFHFGRVVCNNTPVKGTFRWADENIRPGATDSNSTEYRVEFIPENKSKYGNGIGFPLKLHVYKEKNEGAFSSFIWHAAENDLVPEEYLKGRDKLDPVFSLNNVFSSKASLRTVSTEAAVKAVAKALLKQPEGKRAISLEGPLVYLMGGPTLLGDNINEKSVLEYNKDRREEKDRYYRSTGDGTDGYIFFDAPMRDNSLKDEYGIPQGRSGCQVLREKLLDIFSELKDRGIPVDYVYCDFENIENNVRVLRNRHRLELDKNMHLVTGKHLTGEALDAALAKHWNIIWNNRRFQKEIKPELMKRGFKIIAPNDPLIFLRTLPDMSYGLFTEERKINIRKNLNIWHTVMKNYTQGLFRTYVISPIRQFYPQAKCSAWYNNDSNGWQNTAYMYESYLGGSTEAGEDLYSCTPIYAHISSEGNQKHNIDNWNRNIIKTAFTFLQHSISVYRDAVLSSNGRVHPFVTQKYFFTETLKYRDLEYYKDYILHVLLHNPDKMIAYVNYDDFFSLDSKEADANMIYPGRLFFINDVLDELNGICKEFREVTRGEVDLKYLAEKIVSETDPFIISGIKAGNRNIWRITPDIYEKGVKTLNLQQFMESFYRGEKQDADHNKWQEFQLKGKTVKFPGGKIIKPAVPGGNSALQCGYWVETKAGVRPEISVSKNPDGTIPDYFANRVIWAEDFEDFSPGTHLDKFKESDTPKNYQVENDGGNKVATGYSAMVNEGIMSETTAVGQWARNQVWEIRVKFKKDLSSSSRSKGVHLLATGVNPSGLKGLNKVLTFRGDGIFYYKQEANNHAPEPNVNNENNKKLYSGPIESNKWYRVRRIFDCSNPKAVKNTIEIFNEEGNRIVNMVDEPLGKIEESSSDYPFSSAVFAYNFDNTPDNPTKISIDDCKIYLTGFNAKAEIFSKKDGINLSRVKENVANTDDALLAKVTWLNAAKKDITYKLIIEEKNGGGSTIKTTTLKKEKVVYGDNSYSLAEIPKLQPNTRKVKVVLKDVTVSDTGKILQEDYIDIVPAGEKILPLANPEASVSSGYSKIVFDPTPNGRIGSNPLGQKLAFKVIKGVTWGEIKGHLPKSAIYKDDTSRFVYWEPGTLLDLQLVHDENYRAEYMRVKVPPELDKVKPLVSDEDEPGEGYVKIVFDPTSEGRLDGYDLGVKKAYAVRGDLNWGEVKNSLKHTVSYKDETKTFAGWNPPMPADHERVSRITFVAQYSQNQPVIAVTDPSSPTPSGYAKITFEGGSHCLELQGSSQFFVIKNLTVNLTAHAPKVIPKTGYKYKSWNRDLNIYTDRDLTIEAIYEVMGRWTKLSSASASVPEGYVKIVFDPTSHGKIKGEAQGVKVAYGVREDLSWGDVKDELNYETFSINPSKRFKGWSPPLPKDGDKVKSLIHTAVYEDLPEIKVLEDPSGSVEEEYVKALFDPTSEGKLEGLGMGVKKGYGIRKDLTWGEVKDRLPKKAQYRDATKKFTDWNPPMPTDVTKVNNRIFEAKYESEKAIIEVTDPNLPTPSGYAKITFEKGEQGDCLQGTYMFFVMKNVQVNLNGKVPVAVPKPGYRFTSWSGNLLFSTDRDKTIVAQYTETEKVKELETEGDSVPEGYVKVVFDPTGDGKLGDGDLGVKKVYAVRGDLSWGAVKSRILKDAKYKNSDKKFNGWLPNLPNDTEIVLDKVYTAIYKENRRVIELENEYVAAPEGYVKIIFDPTEEGRLLGKDPGVKKTVGVREDLTWKEVKSAVIPVAKYNDNTKEFEKWSPALPKNHEFPTDKTYTARFSAKPEIKVLESAVAPVPAGYVKIIFDPTGEGSFEDTGDGIKKIFAVREDLNWGNVKNRLPKQALYKDDTKKFDRWEPALPADSDRIETNTHVALYKDEADIIPIFTPSAETPKGYIRASFINNHPSVANLNGACEFFLKKGVYVDLTDSAPLVTVKSGYRFIGWASEIKGRFNEDISFGTVCGELEKIISVNDENEPSKEGYVRLTFDPTKDGRLPELSSLGKKKIFDIRDDLLWKDVKDKMPKEAVYKDSSKAFHRWLPGLPENDGMLTAKTYRAEYEEKPYIKEMYNPGADAEEGYVKIVFDPTINGRLEGGAWGERKAYALREDLNWSMLKGAALYNDWPKYAVYKNATKTFENWHPVSYWNIPGDTKVYNITFKAGYREEPYILEGDVTLDGYSKVEFKPDINTDKIIGMTKFNVRKDVYVDLTDRAPEVFCRSGYKFKSWNKSMKGVFGRDTEITVVSEAAENFGVFFEYDSKILHKEYVEKGENISRIPTAIPVHENEEFLGWQIGGEGNIYEAEALKKLKIHRNYRFIGKSEILNQGEYNVKYKVDNALIAYEKVKKGGKCKNVPHDPKKPGYKFAGWKDSATGLIYKKNEIGNLIVEEGRTFTAVFGEAENVIKLPEANSLAPTGYVKVIFDPTADGRFTESTFGEKSAYALKEDLSWGDVRSRLPSTAIYKDATKSFTLWSPTIPEDNIKVRAKTFVAQYEHNKIIMPAVDPGGEPPAGYAKVTFVPGDKGQVVGENTVYYVMKNMDINITGYAPKVIPVKGYKFKSWDKDLYVNLKTDLYVRAIYEEMQECMPMTDPEAIAPAGYVKIVFAPGVNGKIGTGMIGAKVTFAVRADMTWGKVKGILLKPAVYKDFSKKFYRWEPVLPGDEDSVRDAVYVAEYRDNPSIIPLSNETSPVDPEYVKVSFDPTKNGKQEGGVLGEKKIYAVRRDLTWEEVKSEFPQTAIYKDHTKKFKNWLPKLEDESQTVSYKVFIAEYEPLEKVKAATVPGEPVPDGYVAVTFEKGEKGESLEGTSRFFVLKNVPINLTGYTPVIKAKKGFKFIGWDNNLLFVATTEKLFRAQYEEMYKIYEIANPEEAAAPGYVKIVFDPTAEGCLKVGKIGIKRAFALREDLTWGEVKSMVPQTATYKDGTKKFYKWKPTLPSDKEIVKGEIFTAEYRDNPVIMKLNRWEESAPAGYIKVTFDPTVDGKLSGEEIGRKVAYAIKAGQLWKNVKYELPKKAKYKDEEKVFEKWTPDLPGDNEAVVAKVYRAIYKDSDNTSSEDIYPGIVEDPSSSVPEKGYVRIVFDPTEEGLLNRGKQGKAKVYDIKNILLWKHVKDKITPYVSYKNGSKIFARWDTDLPEDEDRLQSEVYTALFKDNPDIKINPGTDYPDTGYNRIILDPTPAGRFSNMAQGEMMIFDVRENLLWKSVKEQIICYKPTFIYSNKVFYRWNYAFPIGEMPVERATYKAEYISPPKANVEYEVDGVITASESVDLMKSPVKVPENPVVSGKNFKGWQAGGVGKLYTKAELEHMEIVRNMTFVAKLEKDSADPPSPTPGPMPGPGPIPGPTPGPSPDSENALIIDSENTIVLTPLQQKEMNEGKYSYMKLTVKKVSVKMMAEQFKALYNSADTASYFRVIAKSKHRVMSKYWKKRIAGRFVYRIKLAVSGKEPDGYVTVSIKAGLPYVGKRPADGDKVYVMKLYREKIRKKGRIKKVFVKKGSLIPGIYNEKEDAVLFERKNGLKKQYFAVVKQ